MQGSMRFLSSLFAAVFVVLFTLGTLTLPGAHATADEPILPPNGNDCGGCQCHEGAGVICSYKDLGQWTDCFWTLYQCNCIVVDEIETCVQVSHG